MSVRKEQEHILQQANRRLLLQGAIDRREFLTRACHAGRDGVRMEFRPSPLEALHSL